jgi:hypothetical protein
VCPAVRAGPEALWLETLKGAESQPDSIKVFNSHVNDRSFADVDVLAAVDGFKNPSQSK